MRPLESIRRAAGWLSQRYDEGVEGAAVRPTVTRAPAYVDAIDISSAQRPELFDAAKLRAAGVSRVIVKLSEGIDYADPCAKAHCAWVRAASLDLGAYHFLRVRHGRPQDATEQARQFCDIYRREGCTWRPAVDCELGPSTAAYAEHNAATGAEWAEAVTDWVSEVEDQLAIVPEVGNPSCATYDPLRAPIIYCGAGHWDTHPELRTSYLAAQDLWVAHYGVEKPTVPKPWAAWFGWQYTGSGVVAGYPHALDRSRFTA